jgi:hypothetical protein
MYMTTLSEMPAWYLNTPGGQKVVADQVRKLGLERKQTAAILEALPDRRQKAIAPLAAKVEEARTAMEVAKADYLAKEAIFRTASVARDSQAASFHAEQARLERALRQSAPAKVSEFREKLEAEIAHLCDPQTKQTTFKDAFNPFEARTRHVAGSNFQGIQDRLRAIRAWLRDEWPALELHAGTDDDLEKRIAEVWKGFPRTDIIMFADGTKG